MADKEIVKCMFIDEPEILDAAIAKLPPELAEKYTNRALQQIERLPEKNVRAMLLDITSRLLQREY